MSQLIARLKDLQLGTDWLSPRQRQLLATTAAAAAAITVGGTALLSLKMWWSKRNLPPGPTAWPLVGSIGVFSAKGDYAFYEKHDELYKQYGDLITIVLGSQPMVLVLDPDLVLEALVSKSLSDRGFDVNSMVYATEGMNDIFAAPNSERWRFHRKSAYGAFRQFAQGEQLEQQLLSAFDVSAKHIGCSEPRDLYEVLAYITYCLQGATVLGKEYDMKDPNYQLLRQNMEELNQAFSAGILSDMLPILRYLPLPSERKFVRLSENVFKWARDHCDQHKAAFNPNEKNDILDYLISEQREANSAGKGEFFQDVHLRQTLLDIFFAGTETTTTTLYLCIRSLCKYPKMQQRCYEEICQVFGEQGTPTFSKRNELAFTDAFLHEVMRMWPVLLAIPRLTSEDMKLGNYVIAKGTNVMLSVIRCHMSPKLFHKPDEFNPERFLDSSKTKMAAHQRGFIPFGGGVRICLGESIAKKSIFLLLVLLIQKFHFEWDGTDTGRGISEDSNCLFGLPKRFNATAKLRQ